MVQAYLFPHGFRVSDGGTEEAIPLQSPVQSGPVVVTIPRVWQAPRDERPKLLVCGVT